MEVKELLKEKTVLAWFARINCTQSSHSAYAQALYDYTTAIDKNPTELIEEARREKKMGLDLEETKLYDYFVRFRTKLTEHKTKYCRPLADMTVRNRIAAVKSFYAAFGIETPKMNQRGKKGKPRPQKEHRSIPEKDDLQKVLAVCNPIERAIFLTGISGGLAASDITEIKLEDFIQGYDPDTEITKLSLTRVKTGVEFTTFLSPEASRAVQAYLAFRNREIKTGDVKRLAQLEKQRLVKGGYLFIKQNIKKSYLMTKNERDRKLESYMIIKMYQSLADRAGITAQKGEWNLIRSHNMRKYFNTELNLAGCNVNIIEHLMGHSLGDVKDAYLIPSDEKLKEVYKQFAPYLVIEKSLDVASSPEFQAEVNRRKTAETEAVRVGVDRSEIQKVYDEIQQLKSEFSALSMEFSPVLNAAKQWEAAVEEATGVGFDDVVQLGDPEKIVPKSAILKIHDAKRSTDIDYKNRWTKFQKLAGHRIESKVTSKAAELGKNMLKALPSAVSDPDPADVPAQSPVNIAKPFTGAKTLADNL